MINVVIFLLGYFQISGSFDQGRVHLALTVNKTNKYHYLGFGLVKV